MPSYATAIGSSADQPAALAELVGILLNQGVRLPTQRLEWLHFAEGTPYETLLVRGEGKPERVLPKEVARAALRALVDVVENGTARRLKGLSRGKTAPSLQQEAKQAPGIIATSFTGAGGRLLARKVDESNSHLCFLPGREILRCRDSLCARASGGKLRFHKRPCCTASQSPEPGSAACCNRETQGISDHRRARKGKT